MSPRGQRRQRGPSRCRSCGQPVALFKLRGAWRTFSARPVHRGGGPQLPSAAYPVEGRQAWPVADLVEELMGRYACDRAEAEDHAAAMPWHLLHACPLGTHDHQPVIDLKEPTH